MSSPTVAQWRTSSNPVPSLPLGSWPGLGTRSVNIQSKEKFFDKDDYSKKILNQNRIPKVLKFII